MIFGGRYPRIAAALARLPDETVVDGEVVALGEDGRPSFNALQNYGSSRGEFLFYVFDVLILAGRDVMTETLSARRALLEKRVLPRLREPIRASAALPPPLSALVRSVKAQKLEGLVANDSPAAMSRACAQEIGRRCVLTRDRNS
jgi:ATP-dependent DNA ligase